jgi:HSP20 family molecular chaperone IbpA
MAFFPHFSSGEFTPLFRLLDDYDVHRSSAGRPAGRSSTVRSFAPRFDVREVKDAYHLDGELAGVNQNDIEIEFSDPQTLLIKGHVKRAYAEESEANQTPPSKNDHQPTVEEEEGTDTTVSKTDDKKQQMSKPKTPGHKYWVSERAVGEFHRTFTFPERVNQDAVRASLNDGILSVTVPKAAPPVSKKIRID